MTPKVAMRLAAFAFVSVFAQISPTTAAAAPFVYVPTGENAEVVVIDAATHMPVGRLPGLSAAHGLAGTPDGNRLIVGSFDEWEAGDAAPEKPAAVSAEDHAAHHAPADATETGATVSAVSVIDADTQSVIRRIDVPGAVHHVAVSPDGRVAAVTHPYADTVTIIDLEDLEVIKTIKTGALPNYAAFSVNGEKLFVSNSGEDTIAVLGRTDWSVSRKISTGASPEHLALSVDGGTLFVSNVADGSISVIDALEERATDILTIGADLHGLDISDDGTTLFVAVRGDDRLTAIDLRDGSRRNVDLSPSPYHLSVIDGAGVLYVSSAEASIIWVIDTATLKMRAEIELPGTGHQFAQVPGR